MSTETTTTRQISEEAKRRLEVKKQNDEAAKAFIPQAEAEYAKLFGTDGLDEVQKKALGELIFAKARKLYMDSVKKSTSTGTRDPKGVLKRMLQKAMGYAKKAQLSDDVIMDLVVEASKDPIMPKEQTEAAPSA